MMVITVREVRRGAARGGDGPRVRQIWLMCVYKCTLSLSLYLALSLSLYIYIYVYISISLYLSLSLYIYIYIYISISLSLYIYIYIIGDTILQLCCAVLYYAMLCYAMLYQPYSANLSLKRTPANKNMNKQSTYDINTINNNSENNT